MNWYKSIKAQNQNILPNETETDTKSREQLPQVNQNQSEDLPIKQLDTNTLTKYFNRLPFVHFTVLRVGYSDGTFEDTQVENSFRQKGVKANTSAVEIDKSNITASLDQAFDYFYHHAERLNRESLRSLKNKKPRSAQGGLVIISNDNPTVQNKSIDAPGQVFLGQSGPEAVLGVFPLEEMPISIPSDPPQFGKLDFNTLYQQKQRRQNAKEKFKQLYLTCLQNLIHQKQHL